jgi:hypothetical protein
MAIKGEKSMSALSIVVGSWLVLNAALVVAFDAAAR